MKSPWPTKKLGEICKIRTGKKDVDEGNPKGPYPFFTCSREITYSDTYSFDTEAILIAGNGDVGNTKIYKGKFEAYQRTYVLDGFQDNIKYIYYYLIGNLKKILKKLGSTMPYIRKGDLETFEIPLPPLPIQQKIVKILDTIQSAIEIQEKIIEKTKELKKSLMNLLFHYGIKGLSIKLLTSYRVSELNSSRVGELKSEELEKLGLKLKKTEIGEIPEHWEVVRLGEAYEITTKPPNFEMKKFELIPFVPMEEIGFGTTNPKYYMKKMEEISSGVYFEKGDLLLAKITPSFENGKQSIVENIPLNFGIATTEVIPIKQSSKSSIYYLFYYLQKEDVRNNLAEKMEGTTGRKRLSKDVLLAFPIPLPPLPEQQEIAEILQTIDQKIEIEKRKKELYEELFKTMLNKIMNQEIDIENIEI